jgi:hypothetical protein
MVQKRKRAKRRSAFRFDIAVNGERVCLAGTGKYGTLSLAVTRVRRDPRKRPASKSPDRWSREQCHLRIGALSPRRQEAWEKITLEPGDEITIRVLGAGTSERPDDATSRVKPHEQKTG